MTIKVIKTPTEAELHSCILPSLYGWGYNIKVPQHESGTIIECEICHKCYVAVDSGSIGGFWKPLPFMSWRAKKRAKNQ